MCEDCDWVPRRETQLGHPEASRQGTEGGERCVCQLCFDPANVVIMVRWASEEGAEQREWGVPWCIRCHHPLRDSRRSGPPSTSYDGRGGIARGYS